MSHINLVQWIPSHLSEMFFWQSNIQWSHEKMGETSDSYCSSWWLKLHPIWTICWLIKLDHERIWSSTTKWYCWWKKSYTTCDVESPVNNGIFTILTGAGFLSSTVTFESCRNSIRNIRMAGKGWRLEQMYLPTSQASWKSKGAQSPPRKLPALFYFTLQLSLFRKHWIPNKEFSFPIILLKGKEKSCTTWGW